MELEGVLRVAVGCVLLQVAREVDDGDGLERAFLIKFKLVFQSFVMNSGLEVIHLDADTTSDAEGL